MALVELAKKTHQGILKNLLKNEITTQQAAQEAIGKITFTTSVNKAAENGGYLLSSGYMYPANTPHKNIKTLIKATREFGKYE